MKPRFIQLTDLTSLKTEHPELIVDDVIGLAIEELFDITFPSKKDIKTPKEIKEFGDKLTNNKPDNWGEWVYYPWLNRIVHFPPKKELRALRTSRNRNLITAEEQLRLYESVILVAGMSVGSNVVEALVSQGIGGKLILVDMDIIEPSNLNRIRSPYHNVGIHKVEASMRRVWEIDPFIEIADYQDGLDESNLEEILVTHHPDVVVDEIDELRMKIALREHARHKSLPVVMAADDGDNALIDIERYDQNSSLDLFNGVIPKPILERIKQEKIPRAELGVMIGRYFVGADNIPLRMYQSLRDVGSSLPSWPQLGGAAALSGISLAYVIKKILLGQKIRSGRTLISLDEKLDLENLDEDQQRELDSFKKLMEGNNGK